MKILPTYRQLSPGSRKLVDSAKRILSGIPISDSLLVAVSGGADSVALLAVLLILRRKVIAANCNFHLRDAESDRDSAFVREICRMLGVELRSVDFNTNDYLKQNPGISLEMACRELRHNWFDSFIRPGDCCRIATGHNSYDNAETMLLNMLRGSGIAGLKGMLPDDGRVVRPLLMSTREEILEFLKEIDMDYVVDSTNLQSNFRRNYLRNDIMPLLRDRWPGADSALSKTLSNLRREFRILDSVLKKELQGCTNFISWDKINKFPDAVTLILLPS